MKSSHLLNGVKNHYQWIIAVTTFLILFLSMGLGNSASGQYISIVASDLGFSRGSFSLVISLRFIFMGIVSATIGLLTRYVSLKNLISIGFGLMAVVHFAFSKAYSIYAFYLFGCFWGIALALAS